MAEEAQGQAPEQPALSVPQEMNQHEAVAHLEQAMAEADEAAARPRGEDGKFLPKAKPEEKEEEPKAEEAEAPAEEAPEEAPPVEKKRYKLKYKGEEMEKDEDEVVSLAQQGFDYTQKSQALAKEREELSVKERAAQEQARAAYEKQLQVHRQALQKIAGVDEVDLNKLAVEDPTRAQQEFFKRLQYQQVLSQIDTELQASAQKRAEEFQESMKKQARESLEKLETKIPGWDNSLYGKILKAATKEYGFEQKEVNAITDHRAIEVLHDAMKYRELKAAKPQTVDKRVAAVPKVTKPGTVEKTDPKATKMDEMKARLQKSGKRNDAISLVEELMAQGKV